MSESQSQIDQVVVPIVGRPNVGKSTLFNRLIGEQQAITGKQPGVTRDRLTATRRWEGKEITFVDTAGFQKDHPAPSSEFIVNQVEAMIEEGEYIIFVVDGRKGVMPLDREIAQKLHSVADRVLVVVNKVDPGLSPQDACTDFYELGFSEIIPVSAGHNRNIKTLKREIVSGVPSAEYSVPEEGINLSLVGRPNVGKSTLFNYILGYDRVMVSEQPGTTRDIVDISFDVNNQRFQLVDTVGLRRKSSVEEEVEQAGVYRSIKAINFSDITCLMLDWNGRVSKQDQRIAGLIADRYRACMILVNKA
ncbi:MAG: ribosome biogenesis GTPase Der, partial [bacterium]